MRCGDLLGFWLTVHLVFSPVTNGSAATRRLLTGDRHGAAGARQSAAETPEIAATRTRMTALLNQFVAESRKDGFTCPIAVPAIVVEDVPSLGQYNEETNTLRTSDFTLLNPKEKRFVQGLAGPGASEAEVRRIFEIAAHQWIFVHEVGHWWQACRGVKMANRPPWQVESEANRISLAYWRERDLPVEAVMMGLFHQVLDHGPSPVPAGEPVEGYFNAHYQELGPSPAYPWFQSRMNVTVDEERPKPSLQQVLAETH